MRRSVPTLIAVVLSLSAWLAPRAAAHPSSGIVVDARGQVYFQDMAGDAIWKIDAEGKLTKFSDKVGGHFLALDADGSFARADLKRFKRVTAVGVKPALIVAEGGAPIVVNSDGNLYSALGSLDGAKAGGGLTRISTDGKQQPFAPDLKATVEKQKLSISGMAPGPEGSLYLACDNAVLKVKADGTIAKVAEKVEVKDCDEDIPDDPTVRMPALRGLAVDAKGTVYVAATGCHRVVKITADGKVETVLKSERPWSPTGVAVSGEDVYVLEYNHANANADKGWRPRVRKLGRDGKVTALATIPAKEPPPAKQLSFPLTDKQKLEFVWIGPGRFQMGSPATDKLADDAEKPQREVRIEKGFYLGRTTVTFAQFQEFVLDVGYRTDAETDRRFPGGHGFNIDRNTFEGWFPQYTWRNSGWPQTGNHPVGNVSWNDSVKFCEWLGKKIGKTVRLPTEAEWEYACRAGTTTVFFTGDDPASLKGYANVPDEALRTKLGEPAGKARFPFDDGYPFTAPVGMFKPNPWGLYDMLGNVFQWCADEVPGDSPKRVLRGGSYNLNIQTCRCAYRGFSKPGGRYSYTGFRVVLVP